MIGPPNLTTWPGVRPLGAVLIPAGAARVAVVKDGHLNRAKIIADPAATTGRDTNRSNPPDPAALAIVARAIRDRARNEIGPGAVHTILDLEGTPRQTLRQQCEAVRELRKGLPKSAEVSIFEFPMAWSDKDEAFADAATLVTVPVWSLYPYNKTVREGLPAWLEGIAESERQMKRLFPRRRRKMCFTTPTFQIYWGETELMDWNDKPVPLDWWRAVLTRLIAGGWEVVLFGYQDVGVVRGHLDVFRELFGLTREMPSVEVA